MEEQWTDSPRTPLSPLASSHAQSLLLGEAGADGSMALDDVNAGKSPFAGGLGETPKLGADSNSALISTEMTPH